MTCYCEKKALIQCEYCEKTVFCSTPCSILHRNFHDKSCSLTRQMLYNCVVKTLEPWNIDHLLKYYEENIVFVIIRPICLEPTKIYIVLFVNDDKVSVVYFEQMYKLVHNMKLRGKICKFLDCDHEGNVIDIVIKSL